MKTKFFDDDDCSRGVRPIRRRICRHRNGDLHGDDDPGLQRWRGSPGVGRRHLVATYVFNLGNATVSDATDSDIGPDGGFYSGPYGSFVTVSLTVNGVAGVLPAFTTGEIQSDALVPKSGPSSSRKSPTTLATDLTAMCRATTSLGASFRLLRASPTMRLLARALSSSRQPPWPSFAHDQCASGVTTFESKKGGPKSRPLSSF